MRRLSLIVFALAISVIIFSALAAFGGHYRYEILCNADQIENKLSEAQGILENCVAAIQATDAGAIEFEPVVAYEDDELQPPTNLRTMGWFGSIMLYWNTPEGQEDDNVELWESREDDLSTAELIATVSGRTISYERYLGSFQGRYYWARAISRTGLVSDWNSQFGTYGYSEQEGHVSVRNNVVRVFTVHARNTAGSFVEVYRTESEDDINWYAFTVAKDSGYDLIQGDNNVTAYIALCAELVEEELPTPTLTTSPTPPQTSGSGGGGCSLGFSPLAWLLLVPVVTVLVGKK